MEPTERIKGPKGCHGTTKRGTPCNVRPVSGSDLCAMHGGPGPVPSVQSAARRANEARKAEVKAAQAGLVARASALSATLLAEERAKVAAAAQADAEAAQRLTDALSRARGWTTERLATALRELRAGAPFREACALAGASPESLRRVMAESPELLQAVDAARATAMAEYRRLMATADRDEWKRYAWLLERLSPQDYAPPKVVEVQGSASAPPVRVALSLDQAVRLASELEEGEGG